VTAGGKLFTAALMESRHVHLSLEKTLPYSPRPRWHGRISIIGAPYCLRAHNLTIKMFLMECFMMLD